MENMTKEQFDELAFKIGNSILLSNEDFGLGEVGDCMEEGKRIVIEWAKEFNITIQDDEN